MFNWILRKLMIMVMLFFVAIFGIGLNTVLANTLSSTNYQVDSFNIGFGGLDTATSTNYQLEPTIELAAELTLPSSEEGGGEEGGGGPPPPPPPDTTPPVISNVLVINISETSATVTWDTDEDADSFVEYGTTLTYEIGNVSSSSLMTSHSLDLFALAPDTLYNFRIKTKDASLNETISGNYTFTTQDATPPIISNVIASNITETSATISWDTNEQADSLVQYGLTTTYEIGSVSSSSFILGHSLGLGSLILNTLYHYRVLSSDANSNTATSTDFTFTTLDLTAPAISNLRIEDITGTTASILWNTNEPATALVNYGLDVTYGSSSTVPGVAVSHRIDLTGLTPDTEYNFEAISADIFANSATSSNQLFRTLDTIAPVISNIVVSNITYRSADVSWLTNELTNSRLFYRRVGVEIYTEIENTNLLVVHLQSLGGLIGNIEYEFYIIASDPSGNIATSEVIRFQTLKDSIPPSNIRNFTATPDDSINILTWEKSIDRDYLGVFIVASTSTYPKNTKSGRVVYIGSDLSFTDIGLVNGVKYYYTGFAFDTSSNYTSGAITDGTPFGEITPPIIPEPEPEPEAISSINLDAISFWLANRMIRTFADEKNTVETLSGIGLGVSVDVNQLPEGINLVTLRIDNSNYLMKLNDSATSFDSDVVLPSSPAVYSGLVTFIFDDKQESVGFNLDLKSGGIVYEILEGVVKPLENSRVVLFKLESGDWVQWSAQNYFQDNPKILGVSGVYSYIVPGGTYYLEIKKAGYRTRETNRFDAVNNYINQSIELLLVPKKIFEVIKKDAPLVENIVAVTGNIAEKVSYTSDIVSESVIQVAQNPVVEKINNSVVAPTIVSVAVFNAATALPFLNLFSYLQYLLAQPLLFFKRKKRKAWGVVYNAFTKLPVDLAIVRLMDSKLKRVIRTVVTDKQGRYILFAPHGKLFMNITKPNYIFPSSALRGKKEDAAYVDLYYGKEFDVKQDGQAIVYNIPVDPVEKKESIKKLYWKRILRGLQNGFALSGVILTTVSFIITPSVKIGIFLIIHIAMFALFMRLARPAKFKKWGYVTDPDGKSVKNAVVRLFESEYNKLLGTRLTDAKGRYAFLAGRNIYYITVEKSGYKDIKTEKIDTRTRGKAGVISKKIEMEKV